MCKGVKIRLYERVLSIGQRGKIGRKVPCDLTLSILALSELILILIECHVDFTLICFLRLDFD